MKANRVELTAEIVEKTALRRTPAGLPAIDVGLRHASAVDQDGPPRQVSFELRGRAVGSVAEVLGQTSLGAHGDFLGFLGANRNGRGVVLNIDAFTLANADVKEIAR